MSRLKIQTKKNKKYKNKLLIEITELNETNLKKNQEIEILKKELANSTRLRTELSKSLEKNYEDLEKMTKNFKLEKDKRNESNNLVTNLKKEIFSNKKKIEHIENINKESKEEKKNFELHKNQKEKILKKQKTQIENLEKNLLNLKNFNNTYLKICKDTLPDLNNYLQDENPDPKSTKKLKLLFKSISDAKRKISQ